MSDPIISNGSCQYGFLNESLVNCTSFSMRKNDSIGVYSVCMSPYRFDGKHPSKLEHRLKLYGRVWGRGLHLFIISINNKIIVIIRIRRTIHYRLSSGWDACARWAAGSLGMLSSSKDHSSDESEYGPDPTKIDSRVKVSSFPCRRKRSRPFRVLPTSMRRISWTDKHNILFRKLVWAKVSKTLVSVEVCHIKPLNTFWEGSGDSCCGIGTYWGARKHSCDVMSSKWRWRETVDASQLSVETKLICFISILRILKDLRSILRAILFIKMYWCFWPNKLVEFREKMTLKWFRS